MTDITYSLATDRQTERTHSENAVPESDITLEVKDTYHHLTYRHSIAWLTYNTDRQTHTQTHTTISPTHSTAYLTSSYRQTDIQMTQTHHHQTCTHSILNGHFPRKPGLAGFPLIFSLHWSPFWSSSWNTPKLSISPLTQSHQLFFRSPICQVPQSSSSYIIWPSLYHLYIQHVQTTVICPWHTTDIIYSFSRFTTTIGRQHACDRVTVTAGNFEELQRVTNTTVTATVNHCHTTSDYILLQFIWLY